ncbi:MAG: two-component regulator propeller domain-containing protein [Blastocatellia bacterium]
MAFWKTKPPFILIILLLLAFFSIPHSASPRPQASNPPQVVSPGSVPKKLNYPEHMLEQWESEHGLPQNSVVDLARTSDGYLWIGTQEGVSRFDGMKFDHYKGKPGWANQNIFTNVILAGKDDSLWVGTRNGLNRIKNDIFTAYTLESGLPDTYISALAEGAGGIIWIGTRNGLAKLENNRISTLTTKDGLTDNSIRTITITHSGEVWVGTEKGLTRIRNGKPEKVTLGSGNSKVTEIHEARDGSIWIGTERAGLNKFQNDKLLHLTTRNGLSDNSVFAIAEDEEGRIWFGTGAGLDYLEGSQIKSYSKNIKELNDQIHSLLVDYEGILWIGTKSNGMFKVISPKFVAYGKPEGIPGEDIWCVLESQDGSIWMGLGGGGGGLVRMKNGELDSWSTKEGLPDSEVLSLLETKDRKLWVGTAGGLCQFADGKFTCYTTKQGLPNDQVTAMAESNDGSLWIGTYKGVSQFKDGVFNNSWNQKGLGDSLIGDMMVARDGSIWFVGLPGGAFQIKNGVIQNFAQSQGLPTDQTTCIYEDSAGDMWIGTYQNGLSRLRANGKVTTYTAQQGLLENQVFDTIDDGYGNFWLTSNHGIFRIPKKQFDELDQGKISQLTPFRYGTADGMRSEECNGGSQPSSWKTRDGRVLITTIRGLVAFRPDKILDESAPLKASISEIKADRVSIPLSDSISLGPGLKNLEIHYHGLSLIAPTKVQFRYKLTNWDSTWIDAGQKREVNFSNLPAGDYLFQISIANAAGQWSEPARGISIHIEKWFYQQVWFYLLCAAIVGLSFYAGSRIQVTRSNEKLLNQITMSMPIAIAVVDDKNSVKLINNQFTRDLGYTMDDLADLNKWFESIYPSQKMRELAMSSWQKATTPTTSTEDLRTIPREWHVVCKDGSERDLEIKIAQAGDRYIVTLNDITFRKHAENSLKTSREQMRELAAHLQQAREEERAYIAREIHDELGQLLTGLKIDLKWFEKRLPKDAENSKLLHEKMVSILELMDETIVAMRRVATKFRPGILDTLGLIAAIEWQAEEFSNRTGIRCEFDEPIPQQLSGLDCETALFRIFQESLTNVARHSEASAVKVSLTRQNGFLILQIRDNGRGITEKEIKDPHSIGLLGMRERAHIFGGEVSVSGSPGKGTTVTATIPINSTRPNGSTGDRSKSNGSAPHTHSDYLSAL